MGDVELQDLLSLCDEVLDEMIEYWQPSKYKRVPLSVILRLREAMRGLLVERAGGCLSWYHRQLRETAEDRYKNAETFLPGQPLVHKMIEKLHETMGLYFVGAVSDDVSTERSISKQNLTLDNSRVWFVSESEISNKINYRRCVEGLHHLARAGSSPLVMECAVQHACSLDAICASIMVGEGFAVVESASMLEKTAIASEFQSPKLTHFARWLRQGMSFMAPGSKSAVRMRVNSSAMSQPKCSEVRQDMQALLTQTALPMKKNKLAVSSELQWSSDCWIRSQTIGGKLEFDALLATFLGHTKEATFVCMSPDGSRIISGS